VDDLDARVHGRLAHFGDPYTPIVEIPPIVQKATIVTEDERFYENQGIDVIGLGRSLLDDLTQFCLCEGGSTITQQLAKQIYLDGNNGTPSRKLRSILLSVKIERHYRKAQILEFYLNTAYYGHGAYGVGAAAQTYWQRPVGALDLAQAALLGGLPQAPSSYDPLEYSGAARARRSIVLTRLVDTGSISRVEAEVANAQPLADETVDSGAKDLGPLVAKLKAQSPGAVFYAGYAADGGALAKALRAAGVQAALAMGDAAEDQALIASGGPAAEGLTFAYPPDPKQTATAAAVLDAYKRRYGTAASLYAISTYDTVRLVLDALRRAGSTDGEAVRQALAASDFNGAYWGKMSFDAKGDPRARTYTLWTVRGGRFEERAASQ